MAFEYVASGCSFFRLVAKATYSNPECVEKINEVLRYVNGKNSHLFSLLYNAHTESKFGNIIKSNYADSIDMIYADSGGLQVVTQGLTITDKLKDDVYRNQATYADIGMSFDEIPVTVIGETSDRNQTDNRYFDISKFESCARESGQNVKRQIEVYLEEKSKCRPAIIVQGNCLKTYQDWTSYILDEVPEEHHQYMSTVAMASAALGTGRMEDIKRAFYFAQLPFPNKITHMHVLGVGSVQRLIPYIIFMHSGAYCPEMRLSYDSTSHTSAPHYGRYMGKNNKYITVNRNKNNPNFRYIYSDIEENLEGMMGLTFDEFVHAMNIGMMSHEKPEQVAIAYVCWVVSSILNFTEVVELTYKDKEHIMNFMDRSERGMLRQLYSVRDTKDFDEWERMALPYIKSSSVSAETLITL